MAEICQSGGNGKQQGQEGARITLDPTQGLASGNAAGGVGQDMEPGWG